MECLTSLHRGTLGVFYWSIELRVNVQRFRGAIQPFLRESHQPLHWDVLILWARDRLLNLFYTGKIKVAVDSTPFNGLESIPDAVEYLLSGRNCGKVVVRF